MKNTIIYIALFFYTTTLFNPLLAVIKDALQHSFTHSYHITHVHSKHGHHHLENELKQISEKENTPQSKKETPTAKYKQELYAHVLPQFNCVLVFLAINSVTITTNYNPSLIAGYNTIVNPPPEV